MKNTRKLIPALAMLLLSAVLMSTASFAWFSMNTQVSVEGMMIEAKSDQTFLLISNTKTTAADIQEDHAIRVNLTELNSDNYTVYPAAVKKEGETIVRDSHTKEVKFHYAIGQGYNNHAPTVDSQGKPEYYDIDTAALSNYVVKYTFYLTVAKDAVPASNIIVQSLTIASADTDNDTIGFEAVDVVVATDYAAVVFESNTYTADDNAVVLSSGLHEGDEKLEGKLTDADVLPVDVYVYYNGDNSAVTTENAAKLEGVKINITFGVKGASANA